MALNTTTEGNDEFRGSSADDRFVGAGGNDTFIGGGGSDNLDGGAGNDSFTILYEPGRKVSNLVNGGAGINTLFVDFSASQEPTGLTMSYASSDITQVNIADLALPQSVEGFRMRYLDIQNLNLTGTQKDDQLIAGNGSSFLKGLGGNDTYTFSFSRHSNASICARSELANGTDGRF